MLPTFFRTLLASSITSTTVALVERLLANALASPDPLGAVSAAKADLAIFIKGDPTELAKAEALLDAAVDLGTYFVEKHISGSTPGPVS